MKISIIAAADVGDASAGDRPVYTVTAPETGTWRVDVAGTGVYSNEFAVLARGNSPVEFATFEFVAKQDGPDPGYFPIPGMPLAGSAVGRATISAGITPAFRMVDEGGATIQTLALTNDDPEAKPDYFMGTISLPDDPFSIVMTATDGSGAVIQRQFPALYRAQTVDVSFNVDGALVPVAAGASRQVGFTVRNLGATAVEYVLTASTSVGSTRDVSPATVSLEANTSSTERSTSMSPQMHRWGMPSISGFRR